MRPAVSPLLLEDLAPQMEAAGVPLSLMDALLREQQAHAGQQVRHRIFSRIDEILAQGAGEPDPLPLGESAVRVELAGAERDLAVHEAHAARTDWHGERARDLTERTRTRIAELRALLPQRAMVTIFTPPQRTKR